MDSKVKPHTKHNIENGSLYATDSFSIKIWIWLRMKHFLFIWHY